MTKPKKKGDRYFWIKLQDDFFSQEDIRYLRTLPSGSDIVIIYLELLCISLRQKGYVYLRGRYPTVEEEIAFLLSEDAQLVRLALSALENCKLITRGEKLDVYMEEFECLVGSETEYARRKRDYRIRQQTLLALEDRKKTLSQQCLPDVSLPSEQSPIEKETELDLESEIEEDAPQQTAYGIYKNVILSAAELESLKRDFPTDYQQRIDYFSAYMEETCRDYKNHYMTIIRWAKQDAKKQAQVKTSTANQSGSKNMRPYSASDYYYDGKDSL